MLLQVAFQNEQKNFLYLGGGGVLLQQQVAQLLAGVERTQTEGHCSWGWASTGEGFFMSCLLLRIWKYTC